MAHGLSEPLLVKFKQAIEKGLPEDIREAAERTVVAGMKLLYSDQTHQAVQKIYGQLQAGGFKAEEIANGMVNLLGLLYRASKGNMPLEGAYPAGAILLCYVLDDLKQQFQLKITPELIKNVANAMVPRFAKAFGLTNPGGAGNPTQPAGPNGATAPPGLASTIPSTQGAM